MLQHCASRWEIIAPAYTLGSCFWLFSEFAVFNVLKGKTRILPKNVFLWVGCAKLIGTNSGGMLCYFDSLLITKKNPLPSPPQAPIWFMRCVRFFYMSVVSPILLWDQCHIHHMLTMHDPRTPIMWGCFLFLFDICWAPDGHDFIIWACDIAVSYCHVMIVWLLHVLLLSCCHILGLSSAPTAILLHDPRVIRPYSHVTKWSHCHMIMSSDDQILMWSYNHMIVWSYYHMTPCFLPSSGHRFVLPSGQIIVSSPCHITRWPY